MANQNLQTVIPVTDALLLVLANFRYFQEEVELLSLLVGRPWVINSPLVVPVAPDLPLFPQNFGRPGHTIQ
jgi:hypothetical protein